MDELLASHKRILHKTFFEETKEENEKSKEEGKNDNQEDSNKNQGKRRVKDKDLEAFLSRIEKLYTLSNPVSIKKEGVLQNRKFHQNTQGESDFKTIIAQVTYFLFLLAFI